MVNACGLQAAVTNRAVIRYLAEANNCWGVTPASGNSRQMRIVSSTLSVKKNTTVSNELRADRMVSDVIEVERSSGGDIKVEFSAGSLDDFLQAFLLGAWTRPMTFDRFTGSSVSMIVESSTTKIAITSATDYSSYFVVGRRVKTEGFITAANNDYWQISAVAFGSGVTKVSFTVNSGAAEAGSATTTIMDANDVIVLKNTTIRTGTAAALAIDSNASNAFSSAVSAKQLVIGQKVYLSGLGYATGIVNVSGGQPVDGDTFTVTDGDGNTVVFEFDSNSAYTRGHVPVTIGGSVTITGQNIRIAVLQTLWANQLNVDATDSVGVVTLRCLSDTQSGMAITGAPTNAVITNFSGGSTTSHGIFTLTSVANDVLGVAEAIATNANGGTLKVTLKGSHLRNPGALADITPQSFTVETGYSDVGQYFAQTGMRVGDFSLNLKAGAIVEGMVTLEGKSTSISQTSLLGTSPYVDLATTATPVLNATTNVGSLYKNGVALSTAVESIELKGVANLRQQKAVASKYPAGIGTGRFNLTGKIVSYFETLDMFNNFLNHDTISLGFNFKDNTRNYYFFTIPALKIKTDPISPTGIDKDVMEEMEFEALRDPNLNTQFMIDRFSSLLPGI